MTKKVLITGKNSYVGNQLAVWLNKEAGKYEVVKKSVREDKWKTIDFSVYDVVVHVAGIAHIKETKKNKKLYYDINRDLAVKIAKTAKNANVRQFIFLSSMSVYGMKEGVINHESRLEPKSAYGKSKLEAENIIKKMQNNSFLISIIRPPMIYGKGCRGNYNLLSKFTKISPIFPDVHNKRSMIFIDHLNEFIKMLIDNNESGIFFPQNNKYVCTSNMIKNIAIVNKKKIIFTKLFNFLIKKIISYSEICNKLFGDLYYEKKLSKYKDNYCKDSFEQTVVKSESITK